MVISQELWSEYLVSVWDHRFNAHYYLRHGVTLGNMDVVLDCGACEGFFARKALEMGVEKVICVEPNHEMAVCLTATFEREISSGRLIVLPLALGSIVGKANFSKAAGDAFSGHFHEGGEDLVSIITLDQLVSRYGRPTMIKMDLEGSEYEALKGGIKSLCEYRPKLAITSYHEIWDYAVISSIIRGAHYRNLKVSASSMRNSAIPRPVMIHAW
jgi:FkbM family methyltransferase